MVIGNVEACNHSNFYYQSMLTGNASPQSSILAIVDWNDNHNFVDLYWYKITPKMPFVIKSCFPFWKYFIIALGLQDSKKSLAMSFSFNILISCLHKGLFFSFSIELSLKFTSMYKVLHKDLDTCVKWGKWAWKFFSWCSTYPQGSNEYKMIKCDWIKPLVAANHRDLEAEAFYMIHNTFSCSLE